MPPESPKPQKNVSDRGRLLTPAALTWGLGDRRIDVALVALLLAISAAMWGWAIGLQSDALYQSCAFDVWFGADLPRVMSNMTDRTGDHSRATVHPLFSLLAYPPTAVLRYLFGLEPYAAAKTVLLGVDLLNVALAYLLARRLQLAPLGAALATLIFIFSAASLFWFSVTETYAFGCATLLVALNVMAVRVDKPSRLGAVALCLLTFGVTITNLMAGVAAAFSRFKLADVAKIGVAFLVAAIGLSLLQRIVFPSAGYFFALQIADEGRYVAEYEGSLILGLAERLEVMIVNTAFAPRAYVFIGDWDERGPFSAIGRAASIAQNSILLYAGVAAWIGLLAAGLANLVHRWRSLPIGLGLAALLMGQIGLHLVYGVERFLYVGHFLPGFFALLVLALLSRRALLAHGAAVFVLGVLIWNNLSQFQAAALLARAAALAAGGSSCF